MGTGLTPGEAVTSMYKHYADFSGRAPRSAFWWVLAYVLVVEAVAGGIMAVLMGPGFHAAAQQPPLPQPLPLAVMVLGGALILWVLATLVPYLALLVRRMHDLDKSGLVLLFYFIPVVGLILLIVWLCTPGTPGANRFGTDPLA